MKNANAGHPSTRHDRARKMTSGFMAAVLMLSTFTGSGVTTAFAAGLNDPADTGGSTAVVSLTDAEHGSMTFADTEERSKEVEVGSTVEVTVTPDDGYTTGSLGVIDEEGNVTAAPVEDGTADVKVEKNVTVVAAFYAEGAEGDQNAEAFQVLDTDDASAKAKSGNVESTQDYILSHMNKEYTGEGSKLTAGDVMGSTVTVVDGTQLPDATMDSLFSVDEDGDGYADNAGVLINQTMIYVPLYSASDDGDYFVGRVGVDIEGAKVTDWAAAENNAEGKVLDDIVYDAETGLVYVPKSYVKTDEDGNKVVMATRIQLLYTTDGNPSDAKINLPIEVNASGISGTVMNDGEAGASVYAVGTEIQLAKDDASIADIKADSIDSVEVNGIEYTSDMDAWSYDEEKGTLMFNVSPIAITDMKVNLSESFAKDAYRFFDGIMNTIVPKVFAAQSVIGGTVEFPTTPSAGQNYILSSQNIYHEGGISGYLNPMAEKSGISAGNYEARIVYKALGQEGVVVSDLVQTHMAVERATNISAQTSGGVKWPQMQVNLMCSHVDVSVGGDHGNGAGTTNWAAGSANVRIIAVEGNQIVIGVVIPTVNTQAGGGFFRVNWKLMGGYLSVQKISEAPEYTNGNDAYNLTNAKYGVYTDNAATNQVGTLTVQNNTGVTNEVFLQEGTYYVKELPGSATGYEVNPNVMAVQVVSGQHKSYQLTGNMEEPTMDDPLVILVEKAISDWEASGKLEGDIPNLDGIKFRVDYYADLYDSVAAAQEHDATASAVFETNEDGVLFFSDVNPVDGTSWPYKTDDGKNTIPLGTVVITEVSAIDGLNVMGAKAFTLTDSGNHKDAKSTQIGKWDNQSTSGDSVGAYANEIWRGGVAVTKADANWHTSSAQGDATLAGTKYDIVNKSANAVYVNNTLYQPGEVVMTLTTAWDEETQTYMASTDAHTLPYGTYQLVEREASEGYNNAEWTQTFTIRQEGEMHYFDHQADTGSNDYAYHHEWNENPVMRGGIIIGKVDRETGQYISLGEAHLDGATFAIVNKSKQAVYVNGKTYQPNDEIMTIATTQTEWNGRTVYAATTGENVLPYGTYEIHEVDSGEGYLFDSTSKAYSETFEIRAQGQMVDLTNEEGAVANQVLREDWHFQKKAEDSMERMDQIAFLVTSQTTGEKHVIVTDENGAWGSAWVNHSHNTNANDPTAPNSNGALAVDESGNWYVQDSSKLDFEAGVWFTGMSPDMTKWSEDGTSYTVNDKTVAVNDDLRAFPYDTYTVQELRCDNNAGYKLVNFTVTLHRYTADHDGPGLDIDYGTIDDKAIAIGTTLTYGASDKVAPVDGEVVLRDTVTYDNLDVNAPYVMKGELHLVSDDGSDAGVIATAEKSFNSGAGTGRMTMEFNVDASELGGKSVVAFEYVTQDGGVIAEHEDITDENQTVKFPEIATELVGDIGHQANGSASEITLTDTVSYRNLEVGKQYTMTGTLMDQETGEPVLDAEGNPITAEKSFAPVTEEDIVDVTFVFSGVDMAGKTVVAFESVSLNDTVYAVHADIEDENQTVTFPSIDTVAVDDVDGNHEIAEAEGQTIVEHVSFTNLDKHCDYYVVGELHLRNADGTDAGVLTDADGNPYTVTSKVFMGSTGNREGIDLTFENVDASKLGGKDIVVFDTLHTVGMEPRSSDRPDVVLGIHADINDADQTVHVPHIGTTMVSDQDIHEVQVPQSGDTTVTLTDTVSYENLTPGREYTMSGTLHAVDYDDEGNMIDGGAIEGATASTTFTPDEKNGTVDVTFTFDAEGLDGQSVVAFESVARNDDMKQTVAVHEDVTDEGQTVHFAEVATTAVDKTTENHMTAEGETITIVDTVAYTNLIPGNGYKVDGTLHVQKVDEDGNITDGGVLKDADGNDVTASAEFVPETADGTVDVTFEFTIEPGALDGQTVVAFEDLSKDGILFATHSDITDEAQAVHTLKIGTTLTGADHKVKDIQSAKKVDVVDTIAYENLVPGEEYTVVGYLVDAEGNALTEETEVTFTPSEVNGTVEVVMTVDTSELKDGDKVIAFERVLSGDTVIGSHEDLNDEGQTVTVKIPSDTPTEHVDLQTGVDNYALGIAIAMLVLAALGGGYVVYKRRKLDE